MILKGGDPESARDVADLGAKAFPDP